jgi:hypothetical protein
MLGPLIANNDRPAANSGACRRCTIRTQKHPSYSGSLSQSHQVPMQDWRFEAHPFTAALKIFTLRAPPAFNSKRAIVKLEKKFYRRGICLTTAIVWVQALDRVIVSRCLQVCQINHYRCTAGSATFCVVSISKIRFRWASSATFCVASLAAW